MGKRVTWVIRSNGAGPLAILPSKVLGLFNSIAVASTHLSPSVLNTTGMCYWAFQRSLPGLWAVGTFWDTLTWLADYHADYKMGDHISMLKPEIDKQSVFWSNSGLGVVTLPDFWRTMHQGNLTIVRDSIESVKMDTVVLRESKELMQTDAIVMCTGWGDQFGMSDDKTKLELGLPVWSGEDGSHAGGAADAETRSYTSPPVNIDWDTYDREADKAVDEMLPFLARPAKLLYPATNDVLFQRKWRLYRRSIPISSALRDDHSIAIMGQIHTVQTPLVAEVQSFWTILYLLGELQLPNEDEMVREISLWNVWTRKRYLSQGQKFPYSLYDFMPYIDTLFADLGLNSRRKGNAISEFFSPYKPEDFEGFIDEYLARKEMQRDGVDF